MAWSNREAQRQGREVSTGTPAGGAGIEQQGSTEAGATAGDEHVRVVLLLRTGLYEGWPVGERKGAEQKGTAVQYRGGYTGKPEGVRRAAWGPGWGGRGEHTLHSHTCIRLCTCPQAAMPKLCAPMQAALQPSPASAPAPMGSVSLQSALARARIILSSNSDVSPESSATPPSGPSPDPSPPSTSGPAAAAAALPNLLLLAAPEFAPRVPCCTP